MCPIAIRSDSGGALGAGAFSLLRNHRCQRVMNLFRTVVIDLLQCV